MEEGSPGSKVQSLGFVDRKMPPDCCGSVSRPPLLRDTLLIAIEIANAQQTL